MEMSELRSWGKTCAVQEAWGRLSISKRAVWVDWLVELSGSWTVMGEVVETSFSLGGGADRK